MILGAHNVGTAYPPKHWWLRIFNWTAKCQSKTVEDLLKVGTRCFDIRVRFSKGKPYICHGLMSYDVDFDHILLTLNSFGEKIYVRLGYENVFNSSDLDIYELFYHSCIEKYSNLVFQACVKYPQWHVIYNDFDKPFVEIQTVPNWKNFWLGPKYLSKYQEPVEEYYRDCDMIVSMDFI